MATMAAATGFGFNPWSALTTGAKGLVRVASDPRAQQLVVVAGKAYAPDQTAQAQQAIEQARQVFRTRAVTPGPQPAPMPFPPEDADMGPPPSAGIQNSHMIAGLAIGGGLLLLVLLLRR